MVDARLRRSAGGVSSLGLHLVWCPKCHRRLLGGHVAVRLNELLGEVAAGNAWQIVAREVIPDQVHVLVRVRLVDSPADVARPFEGRASRVSRAEFAWLGRKKVLWSKSYFAASAGFVSASTVRRYKWDDAA